LNHPPRTHHLGERTLATRPETFDPIAYRGLVASKAPSRPTRIRRASALVAGFAMLVAACGGSDNASSLATDNVNDTTTSVAPPASTSTPVPVATSPPPPSPTPLPTATPEPLEAPTPSTVLLTTAFTNSSKVTTVGIDEVFFGMTPEDAAEAASTEWVPLPSGSANCFRVTPSNGPEGITLWVVDGHIERIDIEHPDLRTPSKLGLGNTVAELVAELQSQLGDRLTVESGGEEGAQVATFTPTDPGDREFRIVFDVVDDSVVSYRTGRIGIIERSSTSC